MKNYDSFQLIGLSKFVHHPDAGDAAADARWLLERKDPEADLKDIAEEFGSAYAEMVRSAWEGLKDE